NFADIVTHPIEVATQVHTADMFYTFYLSKRISISVSGGAQHSETQGGGVPLLESWSPTEGGGFHLQGIHNSAALTVSHSINSGGGLQGAVHSYGVNFSVRHQFSPHLTAELGYSRIHQRYEDVATVANTPDSDRGWIMISYEFERPLGR